MKNKRGFTLIELIITVALLAVLAVIIILNLNSNLKKQKEQEYIVFTEKVKSATNVYWSSGNFGEVLYENEKCYIVDVESLANTGLISLDTLIDPESNLPLSEVIEEDGDSPKRFVKIYKDESSADFIEYPINNIDDISWKITYALNGGTGGADCENTQVLFNTSIELCTPNKTQSNFKGWYLDKGLSNKVESPYTPTTNVTLYAKWEDYYIVTYNNNGGTGCSNKNVLVNQQLGSNYCTPSKAHYRFAGWKDQNGNVVTSSTIVSSNLSLTAQWTPITYTVTYNNNGGSGCSNKSVASGQTLGSNYCTPSRTNYSFNVWKDQNGNVVTSSTIVTSNLTLTAQWTPITYTVTYYNNGGSGCSNKSVTSGSQLGSNYCTPSRANYSFNGWKDQNGNIVISTTTVTRNLTLTAQWSLISYTVTYNNNGGTGCTNKSVTSGSQLGSNYCTPSRTGYTFNGWKDQNGNTVTSTTTVTSNLTLTAQWLQNYPSTPTLTLSPSSNIANGTSVTATLKWSTSDGVTEYCITSSSSSSSCSWASAPSSGTVSKSITVSGTAGSTVYYYGYVKNTRGESSAGSNYVTIKQTTAPTTQAPCSSTTAYTTRSWSSCQYIYGYGYYKFPIVCTDYMSTLTGEYCGSGGCADYSGQAAYASPCDSGALPSGTTCPSGYTLSYGSGISCYPYCYAVKQMEYGSSGGAYEYDCQGTGWSPDYANGL